MGNLGQYQMITTMSKKVGGPVNLLVITAVVGYGSIRVIEVGVKKLCSNIHKVNSVDSEAVYTVTAECAVADEGYERKAMDFVKDDQFKVLFQDGDAVMIEKMGGGDNPYIVSAEFLSDISNFKNLDS